MVNLAIKTRLVFHLACGFADLSADLNHVSCSSLSLSWLRLEMRTQKCAHAISLHMVL